MIDFVQVQEDVQGALLSNKKLLSVNVIQFRKMRIESEINYSLLYMTVRGGKSGIGVMVEMPTLLCKNPNVSGPVLDVGISCIVMEQPTFNMDKVNGTLLSAEEVALLVVETLHHLGIEGGVLTASPNAITPANEYTGVVAYRCHVQFKGFTPQQQRTAPVIAVNDNGNITLTCSDLGAEIRYTVDGSFPASGDGGNPQSVVYSSPVQIVSGQKIRAVAYADSKLGSCIYSFTLP